MTTLNAPPQAYTRETLAQAYLWLKSQPDGIKERAKNAESLVSLYLHACRHGLDVFKNGGGEVDAPRSSQDFKNTLKDLSEGFRQFEDKKSSLAQAASELQKPKTANSAETMARTMIAETPQTLAQTTTSRAPSFEAPLRQRPAPEQRVAPPQPAQEKVVVQAPQRPIDPSPAYRAYISEEELDYSEPQNQEPTNHSRNLDLSLDARSYEAIRRVQRKMNLSSENEALRMLLSLGFDRIRNILP